MKIRVVSDIHLEFGNFIVPSCDGDKDTVLILAGDIGTSNTIPLITNFLKIVSEQFFKVIYIMGNHEYYHGVIGESFGDIKKEMVELKNVHVVDNQTVLIDEVAFICSTLWTSFDNGNPLTMMKAESFMSDYRIIGIIENNRFGSRGVKTNDILEIYNSSKKFIFNEIEFHKSSERQVVVVSHHSPSFMSVPSEYKGDSLNGAYCSNLDYEIFDAKPDLWIHGHTHTSFDYMIEGTRVICNPRGYAPSALNKKFNPNLLIEI